MRFIPALLLLVGITPQAYAQTTPIVLDVPDPARWEAAGAIANRSLHSSDVGTSRDDWTNGAAFAASLGRYWTPHLKVEADVTAAVETSRYVQMLTEVAGRPTTFQSGEQRQQTLSIAAGVLYQFRRNTWVHPFVGAGAETTRERSRLALEQYPVCVSGPCLPAALPVETALTYRTQPYVTGGFKFYIAERAFIRTDVRAMLSTRRADAMLWRFGIGTDF